MSDTYGYCRKSTAAQNIERQVRNIKAEYPDAHIVQETFTGTKFQNRKEFEKLEKNLKAGDTLIFDSVSRMSRNSEEGVEKYFELVERGVKLVFLKEHYIDSDVYLSSIKDKVELQGTDEDELFKGINNYFRRLAVKQIRIAFEQSEKEVMDLRQRTREGLVTAKLNGKQIGAVKGSTHETKKAKTAKEIIRKHCAAFGGSLSDNDCRKLAGVSRNSYFKYKKELLQEL